MKEAQTKLNQMHDATEALLFFSMEPRFKPLIDEADRFYHKDQGPSAISGQFENYLLYEFSFEGIKIIDRYIQEGLQYSEWFKDLLDSLFSGFEVIRYDGHTFLKEIFTKKDYEIVNFEILNEADFVIGRVFEFKDGYLLENNFEIYPKAYLEPFRRGILEKFTSLNGKTPMDVSVKNNALLLMRYMDIIESVVETSEIEDEDYVVHQATYLHQSYQKIKSILLESDACELSLDEPNDQIFQIIQSDSIIAELVLTKDKIHLECNDAQALLDSKKWLTSLFKSDLVHFSDEILSVDDLLSR